MLKFSKHDRDEDPRARIRAAIGELAPHQRPDTLVHEFTHHEKITTKNGVLVRDEQGQFTRRSAQPRPTQGRGKRK